MALVVHKLSLAGYVLINANVTDSYRQSIWENQRFRHKNTFNLPYWKPTKVTSERPRTFLKVKILVASKITKIHAKFEQQLDSSTTACILQYLWIEMSIKFDPLNQTFSQGQQVLQR